ncbi:hypothetical protein C0V76_10960 [Uliginosibacterium sp. TH139]|nr:hypothetical protein C0V76_10960 [Uliginosibacterium sp. TH139]
MGFQFCTVRKYLECWGFAPKHPIKSVNKQHPGAVDRGLQDEYPAIVAQTKAKAESADDELAAITANCCAQHHARGYA